MFFKRIPPDPTVEHIIECYWIIENEEPAPLKQTIIPDGFTEIIFHFNDPYRIKLGKQWQTQSKRLLAGQIRKHFLLENTGTTGVLGIKFKPASLTHLYDLDMHLLTDKVVDIYGVIKHMGSLIRSVYACNDYHGRIGLLNDYFKNLPAVRSWQRGPVDKAVDMIFRKMA